MKAHFGQGVFALVSALIAALAMAGGAVAAEENSGENDERGLQERCIPLNRVRNVDVVDDRTLIWEMRGGRFDAYKMTLMVDCPSLVVREAFVHSSTTNRLCDIGAEWLRVVGPSHAVCPIARIEPWTAKDSEEDE